MRWIRVKIKDMSKLVLPSGCANCMNGAANKRIPLFRYFGIPLVASVSIKSEWHFCERCADRFTRPTRWGKKYVIYPALALLVPALVVAYVTMDRGLNMHPVAFWFLMSAIAIAVVGAPLIYLIQWASKKPKHCISNFATVKPVRGGTGMVSRREFGKIDFLHPLYVEQLVGGNDPDNISVNHRKLEKALKAYAKRHPEIIDPSTVASRSKHRIHLPRSGENGLRRVVKRGVKRKKKWWPFG